MNSLIKVNYLLLLSLPLLLVTGPFLSDFAIVVFFLTSIFLILKNKINIDKTFSKFIYFFLIFYLVGFLSSLFSIEKYTSLKSSIFYIRYLGFVFIIYYLFKTKNELIKTLGLIIVLVFLYFFIDSILHFLFNFNFPSEKMSNNRFSSLFNDEKILGSYVARLSPLGLIFILEIKNKKLKNFSIYCYLFLALYLILLSGERTALVIFFIFLSIVIVFFSNLRKVLLTIFFFISLLIIVILYFSPGEKFSRPIERIILHSMSQIYFNNEEFSFFSKRHEDHFNTALKIFKSNILLGGGNKSFRFLCGKDEYSVEDSVKHRFTEYAQHDDQILFLQDRSLVNSDKEIFIIYYKNENKYHTQKIFNINNLKDFFYKPIYKYDLEYFDDIYISNKEYKKINKNYVKKNQKLFLYDGKIYFKDGCNTHPHHFYLQIASENGIINLIIIFALFIYIILQFFKIYKMGNGINLNDKKILLLSMIFIQILPFLPSGNFYNNWLSIFIFLPIGLYMAIQDNKK